MIYLASIPRCGSTYLFRSIAGMEQGGNTPPGAQETHGIVKTHRTPREERRLDYKDGDAALFLFGSIPHAVVSTQNHRHDPNHFQNCGKPYRNVDLLDEDYLGYRELYDAWCCAPFPVLFVRYECLRHPTVRGVIEHWLSRPVEWLPWRRRRTRVTDAQRRRIYEAYRPLIEATKNAPGYFWAGQREAA